MISDKAVEAAARAHDAEDAAQRGEPDPWSIEGEDFKEFRASRIVAMRAALQAALPVLLEGKAEEIARAVAPNAFGYNSNPDSLALKLLRKDALAKANRIISILTGESE